MFTYCIIKKNRYSIPPELFYERWLLNDARQDIQELVCAPSAKTYQKGKFELHRQNYRMI
jgi:hypothetical protein